MKQEFSTKWISSKLPRKQRKYIFNAPLHLKRKLMSATLEKELRKKYGKRNIEVRKNDEVKIMRGEFTGKQGKITTINMKNMKIAVEGLQVTKKDGSKVNAWFHPSKVKIISLNLDDKKRMKSREQVEKKEVKEEKKVKVEGKKETKQIKQKEKKNAPNKK